MENVVLVGKVVAQAGVKVLVRKKRGCKKFVFKRLDSALLQTLTVPLEVLAHTYPLKMLEGIKNQEKLQKFKDETWLKIHFVYSLDVA